MERYMSLIRKILEHVAAQQDLAFHDAPKCSKYSALQVHYHIGLCQEAGYLHAEKISGAEEPFPRYEAGVLTWEGHEALERLRSAC